LKAAGKFRENESNLCGKYVVWLAGIDLLAVGALMTRRIDRLECDLARIALIPLIMLSSTRRKDDRRLDGAIGPRNQCANNSLFSPFAVIGLAKPCELHAVARQRRMLCDRR